MSSETPRTATDEWKWLRREVIIRDEYTCQDCGAKGAAEGSAQLEVHHITPVSEGGTDDKENLVTLCDSCHSERHATGPGEPVAKDDNGRWHDQNGKYTPAASDAEILAYLSDTGGAGTTDVADEFSYEQPTAYRRLRELEDQGRVTSRQIGGSLLWEPAPGDE